MLIRQRNARSKGQVMVEMAISTVAFVMLTYVILKAWTWMSTTLMGRQGAFQTSRIAAGQMEMANGEVPGQPVNYIPPMLQIIGAPGATAPGSGGIPYPPVIDPPCVPGNPNVRLAEQYNDQGNIHMTNYNVLIDQVRKLDEILDKWNEIQQLQAQIDQLEDVDIPNIQAAIAQGYADLDQVQNVDLPPAQTALAACLALPPPPACATEQAVVDALLAQESALQTQIANDEAAEAAMQAQLLLFQAQMLVLQAEFANLVATAGFPVDTSNMPNSLINQAVNTSAQAQAELDLANWNFEQARQLLASGVPSCQ